MKHDIEIRPISWGFEFLVQLDEKGMHWRAGAASTEEDARGKAIQIVDDLKAAEMVEAFKPLGEIGR